MTTIQKVMAHAAALGACKKSGEASDWKSLAWLFFSPQGREFCEENNFPGIPLWDDIKRECDTRELGIYIDEGNVKISDRVNTALIGRTEADLWFRSPDTVHRVILMHGAKARIHLRDAAVVLVVKVGTECEVEIDKDEISTVLW